MAEQPSRSWSSGGSAATSSWSGGGGAAGASSAQQTGHQQQHGSRPAVPSSESPSRGQHSRKRSLAEKQTSAPTASSTASKKEDPGGKRGRAVAPASSSASRRSSSRGSKTAPAHSADQSTSHTADKSRAKTSKSKKSSPKKSHASTSATQPGKHSTTGAYPKTKPSSSSTATSTSQSETQSTTTERNRRAVTIASSAATNSTVALRKLLSSDSTRKRGLSTNSLGSTSSLSSQPVTKKSTTPVANRTAPTRKYPLRNQVRLLPGSQEPVPLEVPVPPPEYYPPTVHRRSFSAGSTKSRSNSRGRTRASIASPYLASYESTAPDKHHKSSKVGPQLPQQQQQSGGSKDNLRRSSRSKTTTGSCASSSGRRTSRGGTKLPLASSSQSTSSAAPGPSSSSSSSHPPAGENSVIMNASSGGDSGGWEGLAEAAASSAARATSPPLLPPLLSASSSGGPSLLATAATAGSAQQGGAASASSVAAAAATAAAAADSESDDSEVGLSCTSTSTMLLQSNSSGSSSQLLARTASSVGRLQALLESRGLPPHLFGALGPRMQHLLNRGMGVSGASSSSNSKVQQLLTGLQSTDETVQLSAVIEMCQTLVMGNEDTLAGFPIKQVVPALINLLSMEHNFDMMNHACRALTYMMEALPRSSVVVVDAVPCFLEKLQVIQCMDVAEQSLTALEMLSRRHGKAILQARGVSSCLMYLDFFSINAQRAALATTSNCCMNLHPDEFQLVSDSLPVLASRLTQQDKKSIESVCLAFSRLVDSFQLDASRLQTIASTELLANLQRILVVSPQIISTGTFITVLRMLSVMCANCPSLARELLRHNVAETLLFLLTGNATTISNNEDVELVTRSPQELYEITCLIGELMPRLPTDGLFAVDALIERPVPVAQDAVTWQWRDDRELWHSYNSMDSRIIEAAHQAGEDEISLSTLGRTYTIDFHAMQQINEDTGTSRPVLRRVLPVGGLGCATGSAGSPDVKMDADSEEDRELAAGFIRSLFSVLYEVYSSSAGPAVRCKCLKALLRMVNFASAELLKEVLRNQVVSSHLAGMLASQDLRIVVGALQMAYLLMAKLPAEFGVHFRREGVMHQIRHLAESPLPQTPGACSSNSASASASPAGEKPNKISAPTELQSLVARNLMEPLDAEAAQSSGNIVLGDVLKRRKPGGKRCSGATSSRKARQDDVASSSSSVPSSSFQPTVPSGYFKVKPFSGNSPSSSGSNRTGTPSSIASSSSNSSPDPFSLLGSGGGGSSSGTPSRSRFSGAKASFLASLNPARWGRSTANMGSSTASAASAFGAAHNGHSDHRHKDTSISNLNKSCSVGGIAAGNKEKARTWVREQAQKFVAMYFDNDETNGAHPALNVLSKLTQAIERLQSQPWQGDVALAELKDIVLTSDISPFEVNHSGLISALLHYLTFDPNQEAQVQPQSQLQVMQSTSQNNNNNIEVDTSEDSLDQKPHPPRDLKLRVFLNVFASCPKDAEWQEMPSDTGTIAAFSALVAKLGGCIAQLEQFPVKVHDLPTGTSAGRAGGTSALKFFNTHQLKCNLQRHPSCSSLKQWKGGTVKIDPLALVQAIERYLVVRGYGRIREKDTVESDDETEEDIDDTLAAVVISQNNARHKLQFLIGDNPLPYTMTVYQAVRQFSNNPAFANDQSETDTDSEVPLGNAGLWVQTHTIYYRPAPEEGPSVPSSSRTGSQPLASTSTAAPSSGHHRKGKSSSKSNSRRNKEPGLRPPACPLSQFLLPRLPENVTINDASLNVLCLLRVLHALNRYWGTLYQLPFSKSLLPQQEFVSNKISAKASRQLQDPLVIMTGNLPAWLQQVASACPFLFPFEVRQLLFYATSFDRDRALQRLLEASPELNSAEAHERVTPRLDRRKRTVSRSDILRQAEQVVQDLATSRALLEVQYENEVGTGLGPTLEFYALVSRELQRADLELWLGDAVPGGVDGQTQYMHSATGLFPMPLPKNPKAMQMTRIKTKYRFLGRLMAKAVMDSRMLDMPFSQTLYRVLLGEQSMLGLPDLAFVCPSVHSTLARLQPLARQYANIDKDPTLSAMQRKESQEKLTLDGCPVADLGLDFTLPGYPNVELKKGGKDTNVTIHNLDLYIKLVCHWFLNEGISKQVEALRDGFEAVFPLDHLRLFYPEELEAVFCGSPMGPAGTGSWDIKTLMECCRPDHGFTPDSRAIRFLFEILSSYNQEEQRKFLQFVTGSPRLPVGGFKSLNPPLTVVRKTLEANMDPDDFLPSVMTCVNYLKLPDYSSIEVMRAKLQVAAQEGQHSFHLS